MKCNVTEHLLAARDAQAHAGADPLPAAVAGLSLALACDMRIASENAKLTTAFSKIGLFGDFGGSYFLNHLVGANKAREM